MFEAYSVEKGVRGGLGLAPNGMKVLKALGIAEKIKHEGTVIRRFSFMNGRGRKLTSYEIDGQRYGEPMVALDRATLFELLAREMRVNVIDVHYGKKLTRVEETDSSIVTQFEDGTSALGDLLIGEQLAQADAAQAPQANLLLVVVQPVRQLIEATAGSTQKRQ